jgi:glycosyltransferase involved in cell wall biosynthesis
MGDLTAGANRLKRGAKRRLDRLLVAPAPTPAQTGTGRPLVAGLLTSSSGLGRAARMTFAALAERGLAPTGFDLTPWFPAHASATPFPVPAPDPDDDGPVILQVNPPETPLALRALGRAVLARRRRVGYWVYELDAPPRSWREARPLVNEVWAPSTFAAHALEAVFPPGVATVPHPAAVLAAEVGADARAGLRAALVGDAPWIVGTAADGRSSLARKNPEGAVAAFRKAFPDAADVRLVVHLTNGDFAPEAAARLAAAAADDPRIVLSTRPFDDSEMAAFLAACDVWLSLHRAEGFGLTIAEALLAGKPVVATGGTGAADFLHLPGVAVTPSAAAPIDDPEGPYQGLDATWREPDLDAAAAALRAARDSAPDAARIGEAARDFFGAAAFEAKLPDSFLSRISV